MPDHTKKPGALSARRLTLLASAAGLGAAVLFSGPGFDGLRDTMLPATTTAQAQEAVKITSFADVVAKVKPAVVSVRVTMNDASSRDMTGFNNDENRQERGPSGDMERFFRRFGMPMPDMPDMPRQRHFGMSQGSGFFISADGYAITNNHVVKNASKVELITDDGKTYEAKVIGSDSKTDLALLKAEGRTDFPFVNLAKEAPRVGDWVIAVGNPFGLGGTVTAGIISANGRDIGAGPYDDFIQIDAPVNRGNSGGPAFDANGNVIGVTTAIYSPSGGSVGIGFAIPADTVNDVVTQLREHGHVTRGWIGVQIQSINKEIADSLGMEAAHGAIVAQPQPDGPAAKAGIQPGDVITSIDGKPVKDARALAKMVAAIRPGTTVEFSVLRDGETKTVSVELAKYPDEEKVARTTVDKRGQFSGGTGALGLTLAPASEMGRGDAKGVVVTEVNPSGPAAQRGFRAGDIILDVGGKAVSSPGDVREALTEARDNKKQTVLMRVQSERGTRYVAVPIA